MLRFICRSCLRLWDGDRVRDRTACPLCGGALETH
jgi:RNA polymerase subunit RPABC4/transcription elongation factor Spt4